MREAFDATMVMEKSYKETVQGNPNLPKYEEIAIAEMLIASQEQNPNVALWKDSLSHSVIPYRTYILNELTAKKPDTAEWATAYAIVSLDFTRII